MIMNSTKQSSFAMTILYSWQQSKSEWENTAGDGLALNNQLKLNVNIEGFIPVDAEISRIED